MSEIRYRMGIDLGGTKIEGAVFGMSHEVLFRERIKTPRHDYDATLTAIRSLVQQAEATLGKSVTVGIGMPGTLSPQTGSVKNANSTWLNGHRFGKDMQACLNRSLRFANDANCFALSEAVDGAGKEFGTVFGVILGTGCGGGIVFDRQVHIGANAIAGEWGHTPLPAPRPDEVPGPNCYCGRQGCLETWISGPAFEATFTKRTGRTLSASEIANNAADGDKDARACFDAWLNRLGRGLASIVTILDPDIIVLGGGLSNIDQIYNRIGGDIAPHVFSDSCETPVVKNHHGDSGGVRGAAWLWPSHEEPTR